MSLVSDVPFANTTTYRKDYQKKERWGVQKYSFIPDYDDPLSGPYHEHILPYRKYNTLQHPTDSPDPRDYVRKLCERNPKASRYLDPPWGPPDFYFIDRMYDHEGRSTYMVDFCRLGDFMSKTSQSRSVGFLPDGWVAPETTQRCGYRNPALLLPEGLPRVEMRRPKDLLVPNEKERKILGVVTGESDYMAIIGKTGQEIIDGKLHGDVNMRPQFSEDEILKAKLIIER